MFGSADHGRVPVDWVSRLGLFSFGRLNFAASTGKRLSKEAHNERRGGLLPNKSRNILKRVIQFPLFTFQIMIMPYNWY